MNFIRQNTPFVLKWDIELQGTAIKLADTKVSVIASCARGRIDLTDYIDSIEENTITIKQNKGLAFIGDYSLMAIIESENLTTLKVQEKYVFRAIAKNDPTETESLVSIRSSIVASGGYDSALSEVSQNAIQNAPVAKEFGKVYQAIEDTENSIKQSVEDVLGGASEAYDTLKEIEEYIEKDEAGAVALAQSITRLETEKVSKEDIDSALSTESENPVQNKVITAALNEKVDKVSGKGLSTNDYTTSEKDKLASLENYDDSEIKSQLTELSDRIDNLPQKEGNYPLLHVGTADDLAGRGESVPAEFGFRASGGKSIKDGRAYIKRIKGNSVVWNQKYPDDWTYSMYGITSTSINGLISIEGTTEGTITQLKPFTANELNHKYLFVLSGASSQIEGKRFQLHNRSLYSVISGGYAYMFLNNTDNSKSTYFGLSGFSVGDVISENNIRVNQYDLTQMFQAGNEPTTIEEFNARVATLGIDMYAYNEGQVIHCNTESIKSVGDNAWDEQWENGGIDNTNGNLYDTTAHFRNKGYIRILPNTQYYFKKPIGIVTYLFFYDEDKNFVKSLDPFATVGEGGIFTTHNAPYMRFVCHEPTYKNDIMIRLNHSGWKSETGVGYEPYWEDTLPLPIIRKYFPDGMKSAGNAKDEIRYNKASGKWEYSKGKIKSVDLGTLNWYHDASLGGFYSDTLVGAKKLFEGICAKYPFVGDYRNVTDKTCGYVYELCVLVKDSSYTDAASFKAAMQGVILYYESKDWEWVELDAEDKNFRDYYNVADFGTEMSQSNNVPSAAFSADIIYQFNAVDMIREHEIEINELQDAIKAMQAQLTSLINGGQ